MKLSPAKAIAILILVILIIEPVGLLAQEELPEAKLALPVLIKIGENTGTGFIMRSLKTEIYYLITAKHVLLNKKNELLNKKMRLVIQTVDSTGKLAEPCYQDFNLEKLTTYVPKRDFVIVALYRGQSKQILSPGFDNISATIPYETMDTLAKKSDYSVVMQDFPAGGYRPLNSVSVLKKIVLNGYPTSLTTFNDRTTIIDPYTPLVRTGIVAGKNKKLSLIIIDSAVYPGNSGEPVLMLDEKAGKNLLIGIVIDFVRFNDFLTSSTYNQVVSINSSNSGYSIVEPMDAILQNLSSLDNQLSKSRNY